MNSSQLGRGEPDRTVRRSASAPNLKGDATRRSTRRTVAAILSPVVASVGLVGIASPAHAAVNPVTLPYDISVFPMRDFMGVGGYGVGAEMNVKVIRDGVQIGSAGPMTLAADLELNGFAEVNHPGGVCWNGVTPNLVAGDRVEAIDADGNGHFTVVQNVEVTTPATAMDLDGDGIKDDVVAQGRASNVDGTARIDPGLVEQRVINPDLKDTTVGRRDVRAIFGDGLADGVETRGTITWDEPANPANHNWTATYNNIGADLAALIEAGQSRMLAWERTNTAGDRIGMTLWEYGEVGGPGMGGCPLGDNYAVGGANPKTINIATSSQANLTLSGTASNVDTVTVSVDDHNPATAPVTQTATVAKPTSLDPAVAMAGNTTWNAQLHMETILNRFPGDQTLVASATYGLVQESTAADGVKTRTSNPIGGAELNILKDLTAPAKPTAFPGVDGGTVRSTTAQSVTVNPANEIEDTVRYRVGATATATAEPTGASPVVPLPLSVTTTQTVKARSFDAAGNGSGTATFNYVIAANAAPAAPTGVSATGGTGQATVSWTDPTDDGGSAITGYVVRTLQNGAFLKDQNVPDGVTSAVVGQLAAGTGYTFQVRAVNATGAGAFSTASAPVTVSGTVTPVAPAAPTIGTATPGNTQATVTWTAPTNTGTAPISRYDIQVRTGTTQVGALRTAAATASSAVITGLTNGTTYNLRVRAVSSAGNSVYSGTVNVVPRATTTATAPGAPGIGTAVAGSTTDTRISATARWTAPTNTGGSAITGYVVQAFRVVGGVVPTTPTSTSGVRAATSRQFAMTLPQGQYRFKVVAKNAVGDSVPSAESNQVAAR